MIHNLYPLLQVILFLALFALSNIFDLFTSTLLAMLFITGLIIFFLGLFKLGRASYSPFPGPSKTNKLKTQGVYRYIRHPMYSGMMLMAFVFLLSRVNLVSLASFIALLVLTEVKVRIEERFLAEEYPKYKEYKKLSARYIPFIY